MEDIVEREYEYFLDSMSRIITYDRFLDEVVYEDYYSHDEIYESQKELMKKIREYLHENYPNEYLVGCDYSVWVMTITQARERLMENNIKRFLVN